jgi:hypothetical protein
MIDEETAMRSKEELLRTLGHTGWDRPEHQLAKAELDAVIAQDYLTLLQKLRENVYELFASMSSEVVRFRNVVGQAADDAAITSQVLARWNKVLAFATVALVAATAALVWATLRLAGCPH